MRRSDAGHVILGVQTFSLDTFTKQIMLNEKNMWATLDYVIKEISKQDDGNYVLMKDPMKGILYMYAVSEEDMTKMEEAMSEKSESEESEYSSTRAAEASTPSIRIPRRRNKRVHALLNKHLPKLTIYALGHALRIGDLCRRHGLLCDGNRLPVTREYHTLPASW